MADDFPSSHTLADRLLLNRSTAALSVYKILLRRPLRITGNFVSIVFMFLVSRWDGVMDLREILPQVPPLANELRREGRRT